MTNDNSSSRTLQQQPQRETDPQQQRAGDTELQSGGQAQGGQSQGGQAQGGQVEGEGSYTGSREYQKNLKEYLDKADVQSDAEKAKPRSESEARELEQAEREGKSHSKGER